MMTEDPGPRVTGLEPTGSESPPSRPVTHLGTVAFAGVTTGAVMVVVTLVLLLFSGGAECAGCEPPWEPSILALEGDLGVALLAIGALFIVAGVWAFAVGRRLRADPAPDREARARRRARPPLALLGVAVLLTVAALVLFSVDLAAVTPTGCAADYSEEPLGVGLALGSPSVVRSDQPPVWYENMSVDSTRVDLTIACMSFQVLSPGGARVVPPSGSVVEIENGLGTPFANYTFANATLWGAPGTTHLPSDDAVVLVWNDSAVQDPLTGDLFVVYPPTGWDGTVTVTLV